MKKCVITVVGKDTVGIIARVCTYLADTKVNILDISQTIVSGYFNMMMVTDTSKASKSPVFVFFFAKNSDFNTKAKKLASLHTNLDLTRRSTTLTLNSTKTCERVGKSKISVLETHYFLL